MRRITKNRGTPTYPENRSLKPRTVREGRTDYRVYRLSCRDYEDFSDRIRFILERGLIVDGKRIRFDNDLTIRFIENVTILDEGYEVNFKAGVSVTIG